MFKRYFTAGHRPALLTLVVAMGAALTGCATTEELRHANLQQDNDMCADFGTRYGSSEHTDCMLVQQRRRDTETIDALEKQRLSAEIARTNVEMLESRRCAKDAKRDREEGRRPRPCR